MQLPPKQLRFVVFMAMGGFVCLDCWGYCWEICSEVFGTRLGGLVGDSETLLDSFKDVFWSLTNLSNSSSEPT